MPETTALETTLAALPRVRFGLAPTPLHPLPRLRDLFGGPTRAPQILMKRDDLNGVALGGNKLRKLEWLVGDALARGCDTLITAGAAQSNHCRQTAGAGAMHGLDVHLCLRGPQPEFHTGNLVLDDWLGAQLHFASPGADVSALMPPLADELTAQGRKPYLIPIGGSNAVGSVGYIVSLMEIIAHAPDADFLITPVGSGGTLAGMVAGLKLLDTQLQAIGVGVGEPDTVSWEVDCANIANAVFAHLNRPDVSVAPHDIECPMDWMGPHYAAPTQACEDAIRLLARTEGIFLDPVYSGKAFAALLDWLKSGRFAPTETVVFLHTGGTPALFASGH